MSGNSRWKPADGPGGSGPLQGRVDTDSVSLTVSKPRDEGPRAGIGYPMLNGIDYWEELKGSPSQMETCFAIFANVLELDDQGEPTNEKYAELSAAAWLRPAACSPCH